MGDGSKIEWTQSTWNPVSGCTKVSEGCRHCYIERSPPFRMAGRKFQGPRGSGEPGATTGVILHEARMDQPPRWTKPRRVFVNSLSDLFHDAVPDEYIVRCLDVMATAHRHTFQVLTKRPGRMRSLIRRYVDGDFIQDRAAGPLLFSRARPIPNVWLGVSVESQREADLRIPTLLETPAAVRFISAEPLLGHVSLDDWICVGYPDCHPPSGDYCAACGGACREDQHTACREAQHPVRPMQAGPARPV